MMTVSNESKNGFLLPRLRVRDFVRREKNYAGVRLLLSIAVLMICCIIAASVLAAPNPGKNGDTIQVTADQLHQLSIVPVELYRFRVQKSAIGRIGFNEDAS